ncbi:MAG: hypothetical protein CSA05_00680 [Bacteroidia bacterium]|nr:MAG: hypothetical protein CSB01_00435 [Bacteroidia bacterium]PIE86412.1 MAG: hypothetical protein CSA05_00680 [Bacteroidia bacterium]
MNKIRKYFKGDKILWMVIVILFSLSMLAVYSSTGTLAYKYREGNVTSYIMRHVGFLVFGIGVIFVFHRIPYTIFSRFSPILLIAAVFLLLITLALGITKNEATRWLTLPGLDLAFQTSDFAKFALITYVARILSQNQKRKKDLNRAFLRIVIAVILVCGLIVTENLSTAALLFVIIFVLMYIGRMPFIYIKKLLTIVSLTMFLFLLIAWFSPDKGRVGTWKNRIESFLSDDSATNYQAEQAKIAIATGGFFGKKPGNSSQKNFLPHPYSDFIYAIIIEEYGFFGGLVTMFLYLYIFFRVGVIVKKCSTVFPALLTIGLGLNLVFQALTNMAVAVNLIPVTGQPLPFVSWGGTSIIFSALSFGIILSISREVEGNRTTVAMKATT